MPPDTGLLDLIALALRAAAARVISPPRRPTSAAELMAALHTNDEAVTEVLRPALLAALPGSSWTADEHASGPMPQGDWWVVDPVGGNLNAVQGGPDWNIGVSLVRNGAVALAALYAAPVDELFTAVAGGGSRMNGVPISVSAKTDLQLALTGTSQARPGTDPARADRTAAAVAAMLRAALTVRISIPVGQQLAQVAAGRTDAHWQDENLRSHIAPVLLVQEAGGIVTDLRGEPWRIESEGYVAAAPGVHAETLAILRAAR